MQFKEFWIALRRRWYLVLVALLLAAGACYWVVRAVGPTYETKGAVLILPPGTTSSDPSSTIGNPFLALSGVSQARDVVIRTMTSNAFLEELCSTSGDAEHGEMVSELCKSNPTMSFEATPDFTSSAPLINITVDAKSPVTGGLALKVIADQVPHILRDLQADLGLRPRGLISSIPVVMDYQPEIVRKEQIRAGIVAGVGVLGLGVLMIGLADGLLARRRRASRVADQAVDDPIFVPDPKTDQISNFAAGDGGHVEASIARDAVADSQESTNFQSGQEQAQDRVSVVPESEDSDIEGGPSLQTPGVLRTTVLIARQGPHLPALNLDVSEDGSDSD